MLCFSNLNEQLVPVSEPVVPFQTVPVVCVLKHVACSYFIFMAVTSDLHIHRVVVTSHRTISTIISRQTANRPVLRGDET